MPTPTRQLQPRLDQPLRASASRVAHPLDPATRARFEPHFGYDLRRVRIYRDATSAALAAHLGAAAYTVGQYIHFGAGQYAPHTVAGQRLLAHELAHVVQQAEGVQGRSAAVLEAEADQRATASAPSLGPLRPLPAPAQPLLQCYRVPGSLRCNEVVDWLRANSPYAPEWAETHCTYAFNGGVQTRSETLRDGQVRVTARGTPSATVTVDCPIDRPEWNPTERPSRAAEVAAWNAMRVDLDAHEAAHRRIGRQWRATLEQRFRSVHFTVTGSDAGDAMQQAQERVAALQQQWQADAQAAQDAIDPFRGAVLHCPSLAEENL
ncbi:hypothetical protein A6A03_05130 [Chloroflexus islandicus]|uniref:eCIS core domain-containing protein n=1 Tax=Chloroflexus islandicus TaxID=1707952 RepID=A0A178LVJ5_9CHLR|nr:DUF4157 domain-containing protein [Chloroflexus islandicus]OAN38274.1 hypothetical protein A6A03_05130 [Chloroflexus islandicus]